MQIGSERKLETLSLWLAFFALALGGCSYLADHLQGLFPPGSNSRTDALYAAAPWTRIGGWLVAFLWGVVLIIRVRRTDWRLDAQPVPRQDLSLIQLATHYLLTLVLSSFVLTTFAINLNYYLAFREIFLMAGYAVTTVVSFVTIAAMSLAFALVLRRLSGSPFVAAVGLLLSTVAVAYFVFAPSIGSFADKLGMSVASVAFAALLTSLLFALSQAPIRVVTAPLTFSIAPLGRGWPALGRILAIVAILRILAYFVRVGDQDIAWEVAREVTNVSNPIFTCLLVAQFIGFLGRRIRWPRWLLGAAIALVVGLLTSVVVQRQEAWARDMERARPFASYLAHVSYRTFAVLGVGDARPTSVDDDLLRQEIRRFPDCGPCAPQSPSLEGAVPPARPPHIFMFVSDATAKRRLQVYGHSRSNTPHLMEFAAEATVYRRYFAASSATFQNVTTMFSGEYAGRSPKIEVEKKARLCRDLTAAGYGIYLSQVAAGTSSLGSLCEGAVVLSAEGDAPEDFAMLRASLAASSKPHFVYMHVNGGHNPWKLPDEDLVYGVDYLGVYDAMLRVSDRRFGALVAFLKEAGVYDQSIVMFTADHGIGLGSHHDKSSYSNLFADNLDIPFIMRVPQRPAAVDETVRSHVDLVPTIRSIIGSGNLEPLPGRSLLAASDVSASPRCVFAIAEYRLGFASMCSDDNKVVWNVDHREVRRYGLSLQDELESEPWGDAESFRRLVAPLAHFIALGQNTYAHELDIGSR